MSRTLFGTDGIRGVAGEPPLDPETVTAFGVALGEWAVQAAAARGASRAAVLIGMDTRESGPWLAGHLAAGLARGGAEVHFAGLTTTPGVAFLTRAEDFIAGVMISASHNLYFDNGLKAFDHSGFKLADATERRIERRIFEILKQGDGAATADLVAERKLDADYADYLAATFNGSLKGRRIVLDCANGAASELGPEVLERLGAHVIRYACEPDGRNINLDCGALHTHHLQRLVAEHEADFGAAFDGDADRCIMAGASGKLIDGDHILLIAARDLHARGALHNGATGPAVVATVMSNLGLERALARDGIRLIRTAVGDRYVLEELLRLGLPLGGEQSGHVIFREYSTTGDGLLTALRVAELLLRTGSTLEELTADFQVYPQRLVNVRFAVKRPLEELPDVQAEIRAAETEFGAAGRVLVRFSGTEPLARVMVEGPDIERVDFRANRIAGAIASALGA
jgi:phosphoglucosamine mutase